MMSNPYLICEGNEASGQTTLVLNVVTSTSAGDVIFVAADTASSGQTIDSITDSAGNTYAAIDSDLTQVSVAQFETTGATLALTGTDKGGTDTITITYHGTGGAKGAICIGLPGVTVGHDRAPAAVASASGTSASISSGTLSTASEVVLAVAVTGAQTTGPTWSSGWTTIGTTRQASNPWLTVAYQVVGATTSVTATASWTATVKSCALMASYEIPTTPPPTGLYMVGEASSAAGSATLTVPITTENSPGDTITVGAIATAGSVTGVTDTAGNVYTLVHSEPGIAGDALYVFEAYNTDVVSASTGRPGSLFGNTTNIGEYPGTLGDTRLHVAQTADSYSTHNMAQTAQKIYYQNTVNGGGGLGKYPTSLVDGSGVQSVSALVSAHCQMWLCYEPYTGTDAATIASELAAFQASVQFWLNNHPDGANGIRVIIYQEPQNSSWVFNNGTSAQNAANYIRIVRNYANGIQSLTDPSGRHAKVVYDAAGHAKSEWVSYYPGNAYIDEIGVDYYAHTWALQTAAGDSDPLADIRNLALNNNKPFGVLEMGSAIIPATATNAQVLAYLDYLTAMMSAIPVNLRTTCMWFNGLKNAPNINTIGYDYTTGTYPGSADYRVPKLTAFWNAVTAQAAGGITVTYSGTTTAQAAIVVGDSGVQSGVDKAVGATGTSTAPSVATGTLTVSEEHIIAFFTNASAGGAAVLGDGLTAASTGQSAGVGGPKLKAGYKVVTSTASDTPSATIVSASWAVAVVTHPGNVPVIQNSPGAAFVGDAFTWNGVATGGTGTLTWSSTGTLPPGLTFNAFGLMLGTPTTAGTYDYTITVTDSLGLSSTISVSQLIINLGGGGGTGGPAPATPLPGNILSLADSGSESSTGYTWATFTNASTPTRVTTSCVAGTSSTAWSALAAGESQIATALYPVAGGLPYIASCYLFTNQNLLANIGVQWYDATQTLIASVAFGSEFGTVPDGWTPLSFASVAPGNAAYAAVVATVFGASAGQAFALDLAYLANSPVQILIDWNNPTYQVGGSAGQLFMDVSPFVRFDVPVTYTRGRQDAISQVQPGSASFQLQNDLGTFTALSTTSIPAAIGGTVDLDRRCQINIADETGLFWTRFDGSIAQIDYSFDTTGNTSIASISLTDILSALNRQDGLFCWTKEQVLADGPLYHWSLDDPGNTGGTGPAGSGAYGTAAETGGGNGPPMRLLNTDSSSPLVATIAWQDTSGGVETLANAVAVNQADGSEYWTPGLNQPSSPLRGLDSGTVGPFTTPIGGIYLTPVQTAQSAQNQFIGGNGYYLQAELPRPLSGHTNGGAGYTFELWFTMDTSLGSDVAINYGPWIALGLGSSRQKACIVSGIFNNGGSLKYQTANYNQPPAFLGKNWPSASPPSPLNISWKSIAPDTVRRPHHLALVIQPNPASPGVQMLYTYLDGAVVGSPFLLAAGQVIDTITLGAAYGGAGAFFGGLQLASIYPYALSQQQITTHAMLGQYGMWEQPADDALAQVATYANVPAFWSNISAQHNGLTLMEYSDITGSNALTAMELIAQAENGLLFVDATGALNFHTRDHRMGYGAPDLYLPPDTYQPSMNFSVIGQFMCNEMGVAGAATTGATGSQGATLSPNTGTIQQPTNAVQSATVSAGYINSVSQDKHGVYTTNSVSSPVSLPLITWSRAYAQLGIPSLSYWPDPALIDIAAWNVNSRSDPWTFPASLTIDLLAVDAINPVPVIDQNGNQSYVPLGVSDFYGLEIDMMVAPSGTLPESFPNVGGSLEWFIEGITESVTKTSRTLTLYVSPAEAQRAWIPGDAVYGVLGSTARIGVSQSDLSTPQADGKDVGHDAGPPYWPPTFSATMNNPDGSGKAFVGAQDMRGVVESLKLVLQPPMCIVSAVSQTQSFGTGALTNPSLSWDTIHVDTEGGMGLISGWPNWYVCTKPGFYEISGSLVWALTGTQNGYMGQAWLAIAKQAAQAIGAGTGNPTTVGAYICPVGESVRWNSASTTPVCNVSTRVYLGLGDMVALCGEHNYTAAHGTSTGTVGSHMSIRFAGLATQDDRTEINSSLAFGGTVSLVTTPTPGVATYQNTHTYSYQGATGFSPNARRNTDLNCYQGVKGNHDSEGSQISQIAFNAALIASQLNTHTITSVTLACTNLTTWYDTGSKLMLGYTTQTPGAATYVPATATDTLNALHQKFKQGQALTFVLPLSIIQAFVTGGATALVIGDSQTTDLNYYGSWQGGPGSWTLTVNYR